MLHAISVGDPYIKFHPYHATMHNIASMTCKIDGGAGATLDANGGAITTTYGGIAEGSVVAMVCCLSCFIPSSSGGGTISFTDGLPRTPSDVDALIGGDTEASGD